MAPSPVTAVTETTKGTGKMKRIQYHRYGGPGVLQLEEFEPAPLGTNDVRVRVRAASANPMDFGIRSGGMKMVTGRRFPRALGYDFAGVIEAIGEKVTTLRVGDEVLGGTPIKSAGAFADAVVTKDKYVVHKPSGLSFEDAATLPTVGITAYQALFAKGKLQPHQDVFVHSCLGAVGRGAAQLALAHGAQVSGSCRDSAHQEAHDLGLDPVVDFDFDPTTLAARFDLILDTSGNLTLKTAKAMLKPGGRIVGIHPSPRTLMRSYLPGPFHVLFAQPVTTDLKIVAKAADEGTLLLPIARTVPLSQAIPALNDLELNRLGKRGKLIITPETLP